MTSSSPTRHLDAEQIIGRRWTAHTPDTGTVTGVAVDVLQTYVILDIAGERVGFDDDEIVSEAAAGTTTRECDHCFAPAAFAVTVISSHSDDHATVLHHCVVRLQELVANEPHRLLAVAAVDSKARELIA